MERTPHYRLGLDLGANSLGWVLLRLETGRKKQHLGSPTEIIASGVRMFEAGVEGSIEQGKDSSRGAVRREKRQPRRQIWRRQQRMKRLFGMLQDFNLLPGSADRCSAQRHDTLKNLDRELTAKWCSDGDINSHQKLPFLLRAAAVEQPIDRYELGRALYHLAQRRGFQSNRKTEAPDDEELGKVKRGIKQVDDARGTDGDLEDLRTYAQMIRDEFRQVDGVFEIQSESPESLSRNRVRGHYTSRKMHVDEFHLIRKTQSNHDLAISDQQWKQIERAIFFQRPLKSQKGLVGRCSLVFEKPGKNGRRRGRRRCSMALPCFQEFRLLQGLNHLNITLPNGEQFAMEPQQRRQVIDHLMCHGDLRLRPGRRTKTSKTPAVSLEELLELPRGTKFSAIPFQEELTQEVDGDDQDETHLIGNRTAGKLRALFGERWDQFSDQQLREIIFAVLYVSNPASLERLAIRKWGVNEDNAAALARVRLEDGFGSLSQQAIERLLPHMRKGCSYAEARKDEFPESFQPDSPLDQLPPVIDWNPDIRNPAVIRALTEVRKVVNGLIAKHGKPTQIHIELARELKRSRKGRKDAFKSGNDNMKRRQSAARAIFKELKIADPSRQLVDKWLLAEECGWVCPYTGNDIPPLQIDAFDVEHIYPRKYLDDSFANKTLCDPTFNRNQKKDRLPSQCVDSEDFERIIDRVKQFKGPLAEAKLKRFQSESVPDDFVSRQLNDTRYNSRLAAKYLATLYGGLIGADGKRSVVTPTGKLTWLLRKGWGLNRILSSTDQKDRRDNRHHAVDALCVALSSQGTIQQVSKLASTGFLPGSRFDRFLSELVENLPWTGFLKDATKSIQSITVSHRPNRSIAGPLHAETIYSNPIETKDKKGRPKQEFRIRKHISQLSEKEIIGDQIIDPHVRDAVRYKYQTLCAQATTAKDKQPKNMWSAPHKTDNFPRLTASPARLKRDPNTQGSLIRSVRLRADVKPRRIGRDLRSRHVASGKDSNYASLLYVVVDAKGNHGKWVHEVISRLDAHQRLSTNRRNGTSQSNGKTKPNGEGKPHDWILVPRDADEIRAMENPPFKLKNGETIRYLGALIKNDMIQLDAVDGGRQIYRVQKLSTSEIQLCEHNRSSVTDADRTTDNRIQSLNRLRDRKMSRVQVEPTGEVTARSTILG